MTFRALIAGGVLLAACLMMVMPVSAAINTIPQGATVFIGEQGLDVTAATGTAPMIAWFSSGTSPAVDVPTKVINVGNPSSFYISPSDFGGRTGNWYRWTGANPAGAVAFLVEEPAITLRVFDETANFEIRPGVTWVPTGDLVGFGIETNLYVMNQRPGVSGAPVTIDAEGPTGVTYSSLIGPQGTYMLNDIPVGTSPFNTGPVWNTGNPDYPKGMYSFFAKCNANHMNDNYHAESDTVTLLMQSVNPLITPTTTRTTVPTTVPTIVTTVPTIVTTSPTTIPVTSVPTTIPPVTTLPPTTPPPTTTPGSGVILVSGALAAGALLALRKR